MIISSDGPWQVHVINFIFIDTILAGLFFVDTGQCAHYNTEASCVEIKSLDKIDSLCIWHAPSGAIAGSCTFNTNIGSSFLPTLILTNAISVVSAPFDSFVNFLVGKVRDYVLIVVLESSEGKKYFADTEMNKDLKAVERYRIKFLRGARLGKMRATMDELSVGEELDRLLAFQTSSTRWFKFQSSRAVDTGFKEEEVLRKWLDNFAQRHASHVVSGEEMDTPMELQCRIENARQAAQTMKKEMMGLKSDAYREIYLYQVQKVNKIEYLLIL